MIVNVKENTAVEKSNIKWSSTVHGQTKVKVDQGLGSDGSCSGV